MFAQSKEVLYLEVNSEIEADELLKIEQFIQNSKVKSNSVLYVRFCVFLTCEASKADRALIDDMVMKIENKIKSLNIKYHLFYSGYCSDNVFIFSWNKELIKT